MVGVVLLVSGLVAGLSLMVPPLRVEYGPTTDVDAEIIDVGEYIPEPLGLSPVEYVFPLPEYTYLLESGERSVLRGPLRGELQVGNRVTLTLSDADGPVTRVVRDGKVLSDPPLHAIVWLGGLAVGITRPWLPFHHG